MGGAAKCALPMKATGTARSSRRGREVGLRGPEQISEVLADIHQPSISSLVRDVTR
jgi:hypothetical protein